MFCYRRFGHNETDEPMFTQPAMYKRIKAHAGVSEKYSKFLVKQGVVSADDVDEMRGEIRAELDAEFAESDSYRPNKADWLDGRWSGLARTENDDWRGDRGFDRIIEDIGRRITTIPSDFNAHKTILKLLEKRREMIETGQGIDWAMAEHLSFGTLLTSGIASGCRVRMSNAAPSRNATPC